MNNINSVEKSADVIAQNMRKDMIEMSEYCNGDAHWGGALSCAEIMAVLFGKVLRYDTSLSYQERDKFLLSKGHSAMALYTALAECGYLEREDLKRFQQNGETISELAIRDERWNVEFSGGSLGLALPTAVGMCLDGKRQHSSFRTFVLMGQGECDEGSIWEAILLAGQLKLDNLVGIVDFNDYQSDGANKDIIAHDGMAQMLEGAGWHVIELDGHDCDALEKAFAVNDSKKPTFVIAHTTKGKGISFMENDNAWHHLVLNRENLTQARKEVGLE